MLFEIHGQFHADDLDDAFAKLALNFVELALEADEIQGAPMNLRINPVAADDADEA